MPRPPWIAVAILATAHLALALVAAARVDSSPTYVFTPLVDVVPGGAPLSAGEATELAAEAKNQVDARDIQRAYARLGSTLSLDDLLRGVEELDATLTPSQRTEIHAILTAAQADHQAVYAVQAEILTLEKELDRQGSAILDALAPEVRARVVTKLRQPR